MMRCFSLCANMGSQPHGIPPASPPSRFHFHSTPHSLFFIRPELRLPLCILHTPQADQMDGGGRTWTTSWTVADADGPLTRARRALVRPKSKMGKSNQPLEVSNLLFATGVKEVSSLIPLFVVPLPSRRPPPCPRPPAGHALSHAGILSVCGSCTFAAGWEEERRKTRPLAGTDLLVFRARSSIRSPIRLSPFLPSPHGSNWGTDGRRKG